ncbi:MAG: glycosyltransferase family 2 protein [Anaerolineae bacterium]|nr:glycosyltransferase family 2 protein [Anaerolineae bacterium]MDH7474553.1 glycosyltransferase family 2 protein [Anaerolineae bacterium]
MKLSVIMAAYNEKDTILHALDRVQSADIGSWEKEIIIVDNCSTDGTRELLQGLKQDGNLRIIFQPRNMGKGTSIRTAIPHCTGDYSIIQDADLEYDPAEWPRLLEKALAENLDAVYGSRTLGGQASYIYAQNYWGVRFLTWLTNLLFGTNYTDVATACKMVRTRVLQSLNLTCSGFDLDFELSNKLGKNGYRVGEVPITYRPRSVEEGKKIRPKDGLRALWVILRDWIRDD